MAILTASDNKFIIVSHRGKTILVRRPATLQAAQSIARSHFKHIPPNDDIDIAVTWRGRLVQVAEEESHADILKMVDEIVVTDSRMTANFTKQSNVGQFKCALVLNAMLMRYTVA
jgi:hypothetical protein